MLNERLKNLRLAKGLTLQQVGDVFGISAASVASWEKGKNQPDSRKLSKIADIFGTSVEFLLNGTGDSKFAHVESIENGVPFVAWSKLSSEPVLKLASNATDWVTPLHTKPSQLSFATRYPAPSELSWTQGPIPAGAIVFVDPVKDLVADSIVIVSLSNDQLELARVQLPAKPKGHYLKLITSGSSVLSPKEAKVIGTVVEWRISGTL
jgi:transcriptional regulator with XRE-family HTH domain